MGAYWRRLRERDNLLLVGLLAAALAVRAVGFPQPTEMRDMDEPRYLIGGLLQWEGIPPALKHSPGAPTIWIGWLYAAGSSLSWWLAPPAEDATLPPLMRPFSAVEHALFGAYRDLAPLRVIVILAHYAVGLAAVAAAFSLGRTKAGLPGALLAGGLAAFVPVFVAYANQARPYVFGWSFAICAQACLVGPPPNRRLYLGAFFAGLTVASRLEMLLYLPVLLCELVAEMPWRQACRNACVFLLAAAASAALTAPWLVLNLLGNLRTVITLRFMKASGWTTLGIEGVLGHEGLALAAVLALLGVLFAKDLSWPRRLAFLGIFAFYGLDLLRVSEFGYRHLGYLLLLLTTVSPWGLKVVGLWGGKVVKKGADSLTTLPPHHPATSSAWLAALAGVALPLGCTLYGLWRQPAHVPQAAIAWIEANVPAGTRVYTPMILQSLAPTTERGEAVWAEVMSPEAWTRKVKATTPQYRTESDYVPHVLSEENMITERGLRRLWFVLASPRCWAGPRYDVQPYVSLHFDPNDEQALKLFEETGGALIWQGKPRPELGPPAASWDNGHGGGTFVYRKPQREK